MAKIKAGVIGCGAIAQRRHLPEYQANPNVDIVAVCDIIAERAQEVADTYGAKAYTNYEDLLQNEDIDVISVCLPNYLHAQVSIDSLNAGKHVLCEKPMATSQEEADNMIKAAEDNGKMLMIGHNQRFVPSHQRAKALLESGELGKVYSFRTTFGHAGPESWSIDGRDSWFFDTEKAFIGALGDLGVHKADLIRYLFGEVSDISALVESSAKEGTDIDDNAVAVIKMEGGPIGTLTASWSYVASGDNSTVIYTENAIVRLEDDPTYSLIIQYKTGEVVNYQLQGIQSNEAGGQFSTGVIDHFVESILNNTPPLTSGVEGMKSLKVILAALESKAKGQLIKINE